jgi:hypothetical protein
LHVSDAGGALTVDWAGTAPPIGAGAEATALRVTLANDSTGVITVDNAGTFATQATLQAADGTDIGDVDVASVVPGTAATNLGKARAAAFGATDTGVAAMVVRTDTLADLAGADHDYTFLQVDATGALYIQEGAAMDVSAATVTVDLGANNDVTVTSGTITANLGVTDNAVLDDIAAKLAPHATNGATPYLNQDTSAIASVKGSAGTIYWIACMSTDATPVYLNLYDSTTAILGTTTPTNQYIVPTQGDANGAGFTVNFGPHGVQYSTGIQVAAATTYDGSTDPGANVVITNIGYE